MYTTFNLKFKANYWFYVFVLAHFIGWALVPALVRDNLPMDSIEGALWGHQLEWGYDKNPFLNGWLTALATYLDGQSGFLVYFFSQLSVLACLWATWKLAKNMLTPAYALISIMLLEGIQYYNFHAIDFNDNTLELGLWALTIYYFYKALRTPTYRHWLFTGLFAALGVMAKYYTFALLGAMALFLLSRPETRKQLTTATPYAGLAVFLAIILPHAIWLCFHDFVTVRYVFERTASEPVWTNHFFFPAQFAWQQAEAFFPALLLFSLLLIGKRPVWQRPPVILESFDRAFLLVVGTGPFILTLLLSLSLGIKLRAGWGMPLLSLWGVILIAYLQPRLTLPKMRRFITIVFGLMATFLISYIISLIDSPDPSSANFPGREVASTLTRTWQETYHKPLPYVAGSRWLSGNIGFYSTDHPAAFIEWNTQKAPWIKLNKMEKEGAIFVWNITEGETLPDEIKKQFPRLTKPRVMEFAWHRNRYHLQPIQIGVAFLPPG